MEIFKIKNVMIYFFSINLITFLAMYMDKQKAKKGKWRIKESTLFNLVLLGGGIGGIIGMKKFRHKTKKTKFTIGFPTIVIAQLIIISIIFWKDYH